MHSQAYTPQQAHAWWAMHMHGYSSVVNHTMVGCMHAYMDGIEGAMEGTRPPVSFNMYIHSSTVTCSGSPQRYYNH